MIGPGDQVGGYLLKRKLGESSIGVVFEAVQEVIGRRVVVNVLRAELWSHDGLSTRFVAAARAVSRVRHPGIVCIFDFAQLPGGGAYIAMECVDGESLAQHLTARQGALEVSAALRIGHQLARALEEAARYAVPHGALRPDRIRFSTELAPSGHPEVKILDLEVPRLLAALSPIASHSGNLSGTDSGAPSPYTAPEQGQRRGAAADRADVYSLGVILYEMLAGVVPYSGKEPGERNAQPTRAAPRPICELRVSTPEPVGELIHQMLALDPAARPSMQQVALRLAPWDKGKEDRFLLSAAEGPSMAEARSAYIDDINVDERLLTRAYRSDAEAPQAPTIRSSLKNPAEPIAAGKPAPAARPAAARPAAARPAAAAPSAHPAGSGATGTNRSILTQSSPLLGVPQSQPALQPVEQALAQLDVGCFGLDAPRQMAVAAAVMVTASAVRDRLLRQLIIDGAEHGAPQVADTRLGQLVRVELLPDVPAEFTVTPLSDPEQPVLRSELTQWQWLVTPHLAGPRKRLRVRATNIVDVGGQRLTKSHPVRTLEVEVTVEALAAPADAAIGTAMVRRILDEVLPSDATLEAFCLDYFPRVMLRFGGGMERLQKVTLLLSSTSPQKVLERLHEAEPEQLAPLLAALAVQAAAPLPAAVPTAVEHSQSALMTAAADRAADADAPVPSPPSPHPPAPDSPLADEATSTRDRAIDTPATDALTPSVPEPLSPPEDAAPEMPPAAPPRLLVLPAPPLPEPEPEPPQPAQVTARHRYLSWILAPLLLALGLAVYRCTSHSTSAPRSPTHLGPP